MEKMKVVFQEVRCDVKVAKHDFRKKNHFDEPFIVNINKRDELVELARRLELEVEADETTLVMDMDDYIMRGAGADGMFARKCYFESLDYIDEVRKAPKPTNYVLINTVKTPNQNAYAVS